MCTSLCILAVNIAGLMWEAVSFPPTLSAFVDFINYRTNQPSGFSASVKVAEIVFEVQNTLLDSH